MFTIQEQVEGDATDQTTESPQPEPTEAVAVAEETQSASPSKGLPSSSRQASSSSQETTQTSDNDKRLESLYNMLGGDDEDLDVSTLDKVDDATINKLTPQGRALMRRQRALARAREDKLRQELEQERNQRQAAADKIAAEREELQKAKANYAKMFGSKDLREQIKRGMEVDPDKIDYTSADGIQALIDRKVAEQFQQFAEPAFKQAAQIERENRLASIEQQFPQMADPNFRRQVENKLRERKKAGEDIRGKMRETVLMVDYENRKAERQQELEARRKRARASAQHTSKNTATATKQLTGEIPKEVVRKGGAAIARWLRNNPKEAAVVMANARRK